MSQFIGPVNAEAQAWADEHAGDLISGMDDTTRDMIRTTISDGLRNNLTSDEIAGSLSAMYGFSDERAELIADTETQFANGRGNVEGLKQAEKHGLKVLVEWICDPDPCEDCEENGDSDPLPPGTEFPSGDVSEPAHPNCRCYTQGVVDDEEEDSAEDE